MKDEKNDLWNEEAANIDLWAPEHLAIFIEEAFLQNNDYVSSLLMNIIVLRKAAGLETAFDRAKLDAILEACAKEVTKKAAATMLAVTKEARDGVAEGN
jgi:hypothetical protein